MQIYSNRRKINWKKVNNLKIGFALFIATTGGAGLFPMAPGTMGAAVGVPFAYWTQAWSWIPRVLFWLSITVIGTWSAKVFDETMETEDNQNIVVDEFVGIGISAWTAGTELKTWLVAFILFRILDALKPPPIRQVDAWSKKASSSMLRAFGVIADDLVAGFATLAIVLFLQWLHVLA